MLITKLELTDLYTAHRIIRPLVSLSLLVSTHASESPPHALGFYLTGSSGEKFNDTELTQCRSSVGVG